MDSTDQEDLLHHQLNSETARIAWRELQRFFASGVVIYVAPGTDLVETAKLFAVDNAKQVAELLESGHVSKASDAQATHWYEQDATLWAVVVKPWILVQEDLPDANQTQ